MRLHCVAVFWTALGMLLLSVGASGDPLAALERDGHLYVKTYAQPSDDLVPSQKIRLTIEIGTDTWFTGGTRISIPEVPGLVILQNEQFASNATQSIDGVTWVVQRWSLDVFAQRAGTFTVPPIRLILQVNAGGAGALEGEFFAPSTQFTVHLPAQLQELQAQEARWVASPDFRVEQQFDRDTQQISVGDAIEWQVSFEAVDVMAMMLPSAAVDEMPGLAVYPEPPRLDNSNNRGEMNAKRLQRFSLVAESPGEYALPEQTFHWWNTTSGKLSTITLPQQSIVVAGTLPVEEEARKPIVTVSTAVFIGAGLLTLFALYYLLRFARTLPWDRIATQCMKAYHWLQALRRPALPRSLNPGRD